MSLRLVSRSLAALALASSLAACGSDPQGPAPDTSPDVADVEPDTEPDASEPDATDSDAHPDVSSDVSSDTPSDAEPDAIGPLVIEATPGATCALAERAGVVEIGSWGVGSTPSVTAWVQEGANPWFGAPELTTDACAFHRFDTSSCGPCPGGTACGVSGECEPFPVRRTDAVLTLTAGGDQQVFNADAVTGDLWGQVTLAGDTFGATLTFGGVTVTAPEAALPGELPNLAGTLEGGSEAPKNLDITWTPTATPAEGGAHVYTNIPINHHASGPTFTVCSVPGSAGELHVGKAMLEPLAIITGLEFQGLQHVRTAAAETPIGCIELRWYVHQYVNLF